MNAGMLARNIVSRLLFVLAIIVFFIPIVVFICIPEQYRYKYPSVFYLVHLFYRAILRCSLLPITYKGVENIPKNEAVIFAANHQSSLDIPLVGVLSKGVPHVWLAKTEAVEGVVIRFLVPLLSVLVDVSSPRKAMLSLRKILTIVNHHHRNLMIFPEGTRYIDGKIHDFFSGFAVIAKKTGRPVVPVCIKGINKAFPPDTFWIHWYPITVVVGKPFIYQENDTDELFKERIHNWFIEQMEQDAC